METSAKVGLEGHSCCKNVVNDRVKTINRVNMNITNKKNDNI